METSGAVVVSWDFSHGKDVGVLIVGKRENGTIEVFKSVYKVFGLDPSVLESNFNKAVQESLKSYDEYIQSVAAGLVTPKFTAEEVDRFMELINEKKDETLE